MKFNRLSLVLAAVLAISALPAFAESQVSLLSNLPSTATGVPVDKTTYLAQSFHVPSGPTGVAYSVGSINVDLEKTGTGAPNSYQFKIFSNNTTTTPNQPLRLLGTFQIVGFTNPAYLLQNVAYSFLIPAVGTINLQPGLDYWIVLTSTNPAANANFQGWAPSSNSVNSPTGATLGATLTSANQGTTWTPTGAPPTLSLGINLLTR